MLLSHIFDFSIQPSTFSVAFALLIALIPGNSRQYTPKCFFPTVECYPCLEQECYRCPDPPIHVFSIQPSTFSLFLSVPERTILTTRNKSQQNTPQPFMIRDIREIRGRNSNMAS